MSRSKILVIALCLWTMSGCSKYTEEEKAELSRGEEVYITNCLSCHGADGQGLGGIYPSLVSAQITSDFTQRAQYLIDKGSLTPGGMLPVPITEKERTAVINYIQNSWSNEANFLAVQDLPKLSTK